MIKCIYFLKFITIILTYKKKRYGTVHDRTKATHHPALYFIPTYRHKNW